MLVRLALVPDALSVDERPVREVRAAHERFIEIWDRYGVMVPHPRDHRELRGRIEELPQVLKSIWMTAFTEVAKRGLRCAGLGKNCALGDMMSLSELAALTGLVDVLCVDDVRAELLEVPDDRPSKVATEADVEIAHFSSVDRAHRVIEAKSLSEARISARTPVERVWRDRFSELARHSRQLAIVDRYAWISDDGHQGHLEGLSRLLNLADANGGKLRVTLYAAAGNGEDQWVEKAIKQIFEGLKYGGVPELKVYLSRKKEFGERSHGRHMRFDRGLVTLDVGLEVFKGIEVSRDVQFAFRPATRADEAVEDRLMETGREPLIFLRG